MLKGKLLIALASAVLFLGACSNETTEPQQAPETSQEATTEGYTGEVKYETLYDPTGAKTDVVSITMNFESGKPTSVAIVCSSGQGKQLVSEILINCDVYSGSSAKTKSRPGSC